MNCSRFIVQFECNFWGILKKSISNENSTHLLHSNHWQIISIYRWQEQNIQHSFSLVYGIWAYWLYLSVDCLHFVNVFTGCINAGTTLFRHTIYGINKQTQLWQKHTLAEYVCKGSYSSTWVPLTLFALWYGRIRILKTKTNVNVQEIWKLTWIPSTHTHKQFI